MKSVISAMRNGSKAVDQHRKVVEIDQGFADAYLSLGLYGYLVGTLPWPMKLFLGVIGVNGNRARGLEELRLAVEKGKYAADDARVILSALYQREGNLTEALKLVEELARKYPGNYLYSLDRGTILEHLGRHNESYAAFEQVLSNERAKAAADLVRYRYGEALFYGGEFKRALEQFGAVLETPNAEAALVSWAHLRRGQSFDALDQPKEALKEYRQVKDFYDLQDQARRYQKRPYVPERDSQKRPR